MFADGANALTGLAAALGNYTGYITTNNDGRGIATGFLVKDGTTATDGRLIGDTVNGPWASAGVCDLHPGQAVRPRAVRARPQEGRSVLHGAEQPLRVAVAPDAVPDRRGRPTCATRRRRCSRTARTCWWRATSMTSSSPRRSATLTQGGVLANLWYEGPGRAGVLVQVQRPPADAGPHPRHGGPEVAPDGRALHPPRQRRLRAIPRRRHGPLRPRPAAGDVQAGQRARARARRATSRATCRRRWR